MGRKADTMIRVTDETWQALNAKKKPGESFNDVLERLLHEEHEGNRDATSQTVEC